MRRAPTVEEFLRADSSPWSALRWPVIWCTRQFLEDTRWQFSWWYAPAYHRWDCDTTAYAILPLVPFGRLWQWWERHRWCVERWLKREGVLVGEEGGYFSDLHGHQVWA